MNATSTGALLLCRADPETVRPLAHLLREQMLLTRAGEVGVLVPEEALAGHRPLRRR